MNEREQLEHLAAVYGVNNVEGWSTDELRDFVLEQQLLEAQGWGVL